MPIHFCCSGLRVPSCKSLLGVYRVVCPTTWLCWLTHRAYQSVPLNSLKDYGRYGERMRKRAKRGQVTAENTTACLQPCTSPLGLRIAGMPMVIPMCVYMCICVIPVHTHLYTEHIQVSLLMCVACICPQKCVHATAMETLSALTQLHRHCRVSSYLCLTFLKLSWGTVVAGAGWVVAGGVVDARHLPRLHILVVISLTW